MIKTSVLECIRKSDTWLFRKNALKNKRGGSVRNSIKREQTLELFSSKSMQSCGIMFLALCIALISPPLADTPRNAHGNADNLLSSFCAPSGEISLAARAAAAEFYALTEKNAQSEIPPQKISGAHCLLCIIEDITPFNVGPLPPPQIFVPCTPHISNAAALFKSQTASPPLGSRAPPLLLTAALLLPNTA